MYLYRYTYVFYGEDGTDCRLLLHTYQVTVVTKCYFHIDIGEPSLKRVSKAAKNTFAYKTKEQALENLKHRIIRNRSILKARLRMLDVVEEKVLNHKC